MYERKTNHSLKTGQCEDTGNIILFDRLFLLHVSATRYVHFDLREVTKQMASGCVVFGHDVEEKGIGVIVKRLMWSEALR